MIRSDTLTVRLMLCILPTACVVYTAVNRKMDSHKSRMCIAYISKYLYVLVTAYWVVYEFIQSFLINGQ